MNADKLHWHKTQNIAGRTQPFGRYSIIFIIDDFFKLKPAKDNWLLKNSDKGYAAPATNLYLWQNCVHMFELS